MILSRISKAVREQNWFAVAIEFVIVIAGVVIGFQIAAWNADRITAERDAHLIDRLTRDLVAMRAANEATLPDSERTYDGWIELLRALERCEPLDTTQGDVRFALVRYQRSQTPPIYRAAFDEMNAVGAVSALSDEALQEAIASFYATLERTAFIEAAGRSDLLATARILWPRVAFSMEEDDILAIGEEEQTDPTSANTLARLDVPAHCEDLELRGAVWEMADANRDAYFVTLRTLQDIDAILAALEANGE